MYAKTKQTTASLLVTASVELRHARQSTDINVYLIHINEAVRLHTYVCVYGFPDWTLNTSSSYVEYDAQAIV